MAVLLIGTLDTKGVEISFVRDLLRRGGVECLVLDAGVLGEPPYSGDIPREEVFAAAGTTLAALRSAGDRGKAVTERVSMPAMSPSRTHRINYPASKVVSFRQSKIVTATFTSQR